MKLKINIFVYHNNTDIIQKVRTFEVTKQRDEVALSGNLGLRVVYILELRNGAI